MSSVRSARFTREDFEVIFFGPLSGPDISPDGAKMGFRRRTKLPKGGWVGAAKRQHDNLPRRVERMRLSTETKEDYADVGLILFLPRSSLCDFLRARHE